MDAGMQFIRHVTATTLSEARKPMTPPKKHRSPSKTGAVYQKRSRVLPKKYAKTLITICPGRSLDVNASSKKALKKIGITTKGCRRGYIYKGRKKKSPNKESVSTQAQEPIEKQEHADNDSNDSGNFENTAVDARNLSKNPKEQPDNNQSNEELDKPASADDNSSHGKSIHGPQS
jgi:hypothetical protein